MSCGLEEWHGQTGITSPNTIPILGHSLYQWVQLVLESSLDQGVQNCGEEWGVLCVHIFCSLQTTENAFALGKDSLVGEDVLLPIVGSSNLQNRIYLLPGLNTNSAHRHDTFNKRSSTPLAFKLAINCGRLL